MGNSFLNSSASSCRFISGPTCLSIFVAFFWGGGGINRAHFHPHFAPGN